MQQEKLEKMCDRAMHSLQVIIAAWYFNKAYVNLFKMCILSKGQKYNYVKH